MVGKWRLLALGAVVGGLVGLFASCGSDDKGDDDDSSTGSVSFTTDVKPILDATCSASGCHAGNTNNLNISDEAAFKKSSSKTRLQLAADNALKMPPPTTTDNAGKKYTISEADRAKIIAFIDQ